MIGHDRRLGKFIDFLGDEISVVVPTWNRPRRVLDAIRSVLDQTRPPLEILVVDDGSTDGTMSALATLGGERVRIFTKAQGGVSSARNLGIEHARGEWVALLDSDDTWLPGKLEAQMAALAADPEKLLCHCDEIWIRHGRRVNPRLIHRKYGGWIYPHCLPRCAISPSSVLVHRRLFEEVGLFDETLPACEDYDLWLRICAKYPVLYLDEKWVEKTGGHADQLSRTVALDRYRIQALVKILEQESLEDDAERATLGTLKAKIEVYRAGAAKRGRLGEVAELDKIAARFGLAQEN